MRTFDRDIVLLVLPALPPDHEDSDFGHDPAHP